VRTMVGPGRRARARGAAVAVLLVAGLVGCTGGEPRSAAPAPSPSTAATTRDTGPLAEFYNQRPAWKECPREERFECARVKVPLDYSKPAGEKIELAVIRLRAANKDRRVGSLLLNPGGPGSSGVQYARNADDVTSDALRERFDIVGFDPRGVGESTPVKCLTDAELDELIAADASPDTPAEEQSLSLQSRNFAERCKQRAGRLLPHVHTADAARDMDVLRGVLGDKELYYLGKSYGTFLGATYAELFPRRVGRMVLDGAVDPRTTASESAKVQAAGFDVALNSFVEDCVRRSGCPIGTDVPGATAKIQQLLTTLDAEPLPARGGRVLTQALATLGIAFAMYESEFGWPALRDALEMAFNGNGFGLLRLADFYTDRKSDGTYANNKNEVIYAVNCTDRPDVKSVAEIKAQLPGFVQASPLFGEYIAWGSLPCAFWPAQPASKPHAVVAPGAKPILVVGTTRDPATPYVWATGLAEQLQSGVLLSYQGDGHTAYGGKSTCVDNAVDRYLIEGRPPPDGTRCK
jgi:pimeloyl-ACP methyl ester carboxylesterase